MPCAFWPPEADPGFRNESVIDFDAVGAGASHPQCLPVVKNGDGLVLEAQPNVQDGRSVIRFILNARGHQKVASRRTAAEHLAPLEPVTLFDLFQDAGAVQPSEPPVLTSTSSSAAIFLSAGSDDGVRLCRYLQDSVANKWECIANARAVDPSWWAISLITWHISA